MEPEDIHFLINNKYLITITIKEQMTEDYLDSFAYAREKFNEARRAEFEKYRPEPNCIIGNEYWREVADAIQMITKVN